MGHFIGLFDNPFVDIPPSRNISMLRYAKLHQATDNKTIETALFFYLMHFMAQVIIRPLAKQMGMHLIKPGPETHARIWKDKQELSE